MADLGTIGKYSGKQRALFGGVLSGVVHGDAGENVAHTVRAYHRASGRPSGGAVSSAATGAYAINTNIVFAKEEHFVIEFDDPTGATYNARILDHITPL